MVDWLRIISSLYSVVLCLTASSLIYVFYVQHIFEKSYANPSQGWSPMRGGLRRIKLVGTSTSTAMVYGQYWFP